MAARCSRVTGYWRRRSCRTSGEKGSMPAQSGGRGKRLFVADGGERSTREWWCVALSYRSHRTYGSYGTYRREPHTTYFFTGTGTNSFTTFPLIGSLSRTIPSNPAVATTFPSGRNATAYTGVFPASHVDTRFPVSTSKTRASPAPATLLPPP